MDRELEIRIGNRIDAALSRIRSKMHLLGMAGRWHVGKSSEVLKNPDQLKRYVAPLKEHDEAKYLDQLPALIEETSRQDLRCTECWFANSEPEQKSRYLAERDKLVRLFSHFQFRAKLYERLARQQVKPLLRSAIQLQREKQENTPAAIDLEQVLRLSLQALYSKEKI